MATPFLKSFVYAGRGIAAAFRIGRNFKVMVGFAVLAIALGLILGISAIEWAIICVCIGMVLGGECANTAIESVVDLASPELHDLAGRAKDCAAGGVLLASIASLFVAGFIFISKIVVLFA